MKNFRVKHRSSFQICILCTLVEVNTFRLTHNHKSDEIVRCFAETLVFLALTPLVSSLI